MVPDNPTSSAAADPPTLVRHIVLTGGPAAGKSTALAHLSEQLTLRGWRVLTVPEAATLLISGGVADLGVLAATDRAAYRAVQEQLVGLQRDLRERYDRLARTLPGSRTVVVHDRGVADNAAYMTAAEYTQVLADAGTTPGAVFELYDTVVHLRSAAVTGDGYDGSGYTTSNNAARTESSTAAAALDAATLDAWTAHPHLLVVGSGADFASKLHRTLAAVLTALGDPEPVEVERKFALTGTPDLTHPVLAAAATVHIEQTYLPSAGVGEQRVRARTCAGVTSYTHAVKRDVGPAARVEVESTISAETYRLLTALRDPGTRTIRKTRRVFVVGDQRFELDEIHAPVSAWLLEAELVAAGDPLRVPAFLGPVREVTDDLRWRNRSLAAS